MLVNENQHVAQLENQRVAQLLHLFQAVLPGVLLNENQRVAQLLHLFWYAARLFQVLLNETQRLVNYCTWFGVARLFQMLVK